MAELTDEERAALVLEGVEDNPGETPEDQPPAPGEDDQLQPGGDDVVEDDGEQEEPEDPADDPASNPDDSFTKQFPNLKGEDWESYGASLEQAYDNSFKEGLRLYEENKELKSQYAQLQAQLQQPTQPQPAAPAPGQDNQPQPPAPDPQAQQLPDWAIRAQERDKQEMFNAYDPFKKDYPQVTEPENFKAFQDASDGVKDTLTRTLGRVPTWPELFNGIAGLLGWQPAPPQNRKNAAIKDAATSRRSANGQSRAPAPPAKISEEQVNVYLKMYPNKSREDAVKELSEVV